MRPGARPWRSGGDTRILRPLITSTRLTGRLCGNARQARGRIFQALPLGTAEDESLIAAIPCGLSEITRRTAHIVGPPAPTSGQKGTSMASQTWLNFVGHVSSLLPVLAGNSRQPRLTTSNSLSRVNILSATVRTPSSFALWTSAGPKLAQGYKSKFGEFGLRRPGLFQRSSAKVPKTLSGWKNAAVSTTPKTSKILRGRMPASCGAGCHD